MAHEQGYNYKYVLCHAGDNIQHDHFKCEMKSPKYSLRGIKLPYYLLCLGFK